MPTSKVGSPRVVVLLRVVVPPHHSRKDDGSGSGMLAGASRTSTRVALAWLALLSNSMNNFKRNREEVGLILEGSSEATQTCRVCGGV